MTNPFTPGAAWANDAFVMASIAAFTIPAAWPLVGEIYTAQCDPGKMCDGGKAWCDAAGHLGDASKAAWNLDFATDGSGWEGDVAAAYSEKLVNYSQELGMSQVFAVTVGVAFIMLAALLFIRILVMLMIALILTVMAIAIAVTAASIVGDAGVSESLEVQANVFAGESLGVMKEFDAVIKGVDIVLAASISGLLGVDVIDQLVLGDGDALGDLGRATVDGLGTITTGLLAKVYQNTMGKYIGKGAIFPDALGVVDDIFGSTVLDTADRGLDQSRR